MSKLAPLDLAFLLMENPTRLAAFQLFKLPASLDALWNPQAEARFSSWLNLSYPDNNGNMRGAYE